jgi:hypothetical protein
MSARQNDPPTARRGKGAKAVEISGEVLLPPPSMPPEPPPTEADKAKNREISRLLKEIAADLKQRNLDWAVLLAQQAARGRGPLVDHFAELGRRFGPSLQAHEKPSKFQVIDGDLA